MNESYDNPVQFLNEHANLLKFSFFCIFRNLHFLKTIFLTAAFQIGKILIIDFRFIICVFFSWTKIHDKGSWRKLLEVSLKSLHVPAKSLLVFEKFSSKTFKRKHSHHYKTPDPYLPSSWRRIFNRFVVYESSPMKFLVFAIF